MAAPESQHGSMVYVLRRGGSREGVLEDDAGMAGARRFRSDLQKGVCEGLVKPSHCHSPVADPAVQPNFKVLPAALAAGK